MKVAVIGAGIARCRHLFSKICRQGN